MSASEVIESLAEVTPAWLAACLHDAGTLPRSASITDVRVEPVGTGQMGVCGRVYVTYAPPGSGPSTLVVKLASPNPEVRAFMGTTGYAGEVGFYQDLAHQVSIRMARAHHAAINPDTAGFTLVLDDLAPAVQGDQLEGLTLVEAEVCMDELVGLHAPRWGDPALADEPSLGSMDHGADMLEAVYATAMPGFIERFRHILGDDGVEVMQLLATGSVRATERGPTVTTIVHGDYRPDNLLIDRSQDPPTIAAVDWQGVRASAGQVDVAFVLGTAVDPDELDVHEERLVRRWYDGLRARGISYPWGDCWADYRWGSIGALHTTVLGAAFSETTERGERMFERMITGQVRQILRLGADEVLRP